MVGLSWFEEGWGRGGGLKGMEGRGVVVGQVEVS